MRIVLGHTSAIECWQRMGQLVSLKSPIPASVSWVDTVFTRSEVLEYVGTNLQFLSQPVHLLVANDEQRRNSQDLICHLGLNNLSRQSLYLLDQDVYLSSPEFSFLQMASCLSLTKLIELGMELCGTYSPGDDDGQTGLIRRQALTDIAQLESFIATNPYKHGSRIAAKALSLMQAGSASPMETFLWMRLCLPPRYGGRGFPPALLNYPVLLDKKGQRTTGKNELRCDLYFPQGKVAIEYDSTEFHTAEDRIVSDSVRRGALECLGISVITITRHEYFTYNEFEGKVRQLAKLMGMRLRRPTEKQSALRQKLRNELLGPGLMNYRIDAQ